jgi:hypothetical protein
MDIESKLERIAFVVRCIALLWAAFFGVLATWVGFKEPHDQAPLLIFALIGAVGYGVGLTTAWILRATAEKIEERPWFNEGELRIHEEGQDLQGLRKTNY